MDFFFQGFILVDLLTQGSALVFQRFMVLLVNYYVGMLNTLYFPGQF